jgi:hypothetical protein
MGSLHGTSGPASAPTRQGKTARVAATWSAPVAPPPVRALTLADELERLAPGWTWSQVLCWPPDAFALTSAVLADSGAYRFVVCPPSGRFWPPKGGEGGWQERVRREGAAWATSADSGGGEPPRAIRQLGEVLAAAEQTELEALQTEAGWELLAVLLNLHALADEASEGAGVRSVNGLQGAAAKRLAATGTLARLSRDRVRVLPKLRPPASGMTLRSLSHHLAIDRSEVETRWYFPPDASACSTLAERLSLLLVPFPERIRAGDFRPTPQAPLLNMDPTRYAFYDYAPQEPLVLEELARLIEAAKRQVGGIDIVVLPEAALEEEAVAPLQALIAEAGVPYLIAGARQPPDGDSPFGLSYAHLGGRDWQAPKQYKHHRWRMNPEQVHQYHLGGALDPSRDWWEGIGIRKRSITFVSLCDCMIICPLVCEDLARPDPVSDVIRAVAPSLVVGLLLDGPQLASRWSARYASVLADDPGCSVLTLTSLGMVQRCRPPGFEPSRMIALWKDAYRGLQQIELAPDSHAVALTAHTRRTQPISADGREGKNVVELVLSGLEQIR